jgi:hypothetical protein
VSSPGNQYVNYSPVESWDSRIFYELALRCYKIIPHLEVLLLTLILMRWNFANDIVGLLMLRVSQYHHELIII